MNQKQRIIAEYSRLIDGMFEKTNIGKKSVNKHSFRGGYNKALKDSLDVLKIVLDSFEGKHPPIHIPEFTGNEGELLQKKTEQSLENTAERVRRFGKGDRIVFNNGKA